MKHAGPFSRAIDAGTLTADEIEHYEEHAAKREYSAGYSREDAEALAFEAVMTARLGKNK